MTTPDDDVLTLRVVVEAGFVGDQPLLERAERHPDPSLRAAALGSFHRLGTLTADRLRSALTDDSPLVRRRGAELASRAADAEEAAASGIVTALVASMNDDDHAVAEMSAFALGELGEAGDRPTSLGRNAVEALEAMARSHPDALCREAAVAALGSAACGLDTILAALDDKATVRRRAVVALAPFDGERVDVALRRASTDRDWQVRQAAEDLLRIADA